MMLLYWQDILGFEALNICVLSVSLRTGEPGRWAGADRDFDQPRYG
jgi:hypothetical protein